MLLFAWRWRNKGRAGRRQQNEQTESAKNGHDNSATGESDSAVDNAEMEMDGYRLSTTITQVNRSVTSDQSFSEANVAGGCQ